MAPTPAKRRKLDHGEPDDHDPQAPTTPSQQHVNSPDTKDGPSTITRRSSTRLRNPSAKAIEASLAGVSRDSPTRRGTPARARLSEAKQTPRGKAVGSSNSGKKTGSVLSVRQSARVISSAQKEITSNGTTPIRRTSRKAQISPSQDELEAQEPDELAEADSFEVDTPTRNLSGTRRVPISNKRTPVTGEVAQGQNSNSQTHQRKLPLDRRKGLHANNASGNKDVQREEKADNIVNGEVHHIMDEAPDEPLKDAEHLYEVQDELLQGDGPRDPSETQIQIDTGIPALAYKPDEHFSAFKYAALSKLMQKSPIPLTNLSEERAKVQTLLAQTVAAGEGNSMLVIGARGSGKTALVNSVLDELATEHAGSFHVIRLNGFLQTDDKLALREIWRQLGREMDVDDGDASQRGSNYADTLAKLLALLSHPDEGQSSSTGDDNGLDSRNGQAIAAKSVVFIMDEFDLFATHPRQTLLYNLFDIAQSKKAPIAILGLTTRIDVTDALEKRVKSRFSHRYVHIGLPRSLDQLRAICTAAISVTDSDVPAAGPQSIAAWNAAVKLSLLDSKLANETLGRIFATTRSAPEALTSLILPMTTFGSDNASTQARWSDPGSTMLRAPESNLHVLPSLSTLQLALLIAAARLEIILSSSSLAAASTSSGNGACNFNAAYAEYVDLVSRARLAGTGGSSTTGASASSSVSLASLGAACVGGRRVWSRSVALDAWQALCRAGLLVSPSYSSGGSVLSATSTLAAAATPSQSHELLRCDVALEEIEAGVDAGQAGRRLHDGDAGNLPAGLRRWCRSL